MYSTEVASTLFSFSDDGAANIYNLSFITEEYEGDNGTETDRNFNSTDSKESVPPHPTVLLPYPVLFSIAVYLTVIGILSTFGNILFILTVIRWRYLRNNSHMLLLLNMAACDLAISITGYPYTTVSGYIGRWIFGQLMCQLYAFLCFTFSQVSMNTLVAVSIFRYIAICHPHMKHFLTSRTSVYALVVVWGHALFWTVPPLFGWSSYTFEPTQISCSFDWNDRSLGGVTYVMGTIVFCYISHIVILVWCYKKIFKMVTRLQSKSRLKDVKWRKLGRNSVAAAAAYKIQTAGTDDKEIPRRDGRSGARNDFQNEAPDSPPALPRCQSLIVFSFTTENLSAMELHVLGMNIAMVVAFIIFWSPYALCSLISVFYDKLSPFWYIFPTIFAKTSCMANPILYGLTNSFLRKQLLLVLRGCLGLTTEIENFEVMRQRQQDGLYNKEGVWLGKRTGAMAHCTCDGCVASRRQMTLLLEQRSRSAGVSPAVSSILLKEVGIGKKKDDIFLDGTSRLGAGLKLKKGSSMTALPSKSFRDHHTNNDFDTNEMKVTREGGERKRFAKNGTPIPTITIHKGDTGESGTVSDDDESKEQMSLKKEKDDDSDAELMRENYTESNNSSSKSIILSVGNLANEVF